jgi:deoxyribodipyrimidine photo-lyase
VSCSSASNCLQLVWFKRDLRVADHAPLAQAAAAGPVLALYLVEPALVAAADFDRLHGGFIAGALGELDAALRARGGALTILRGEAVAVLAQVRRAWAGPMVLRSHEETGNALTYRRDRAVRRWARQHGIAWHETPANGVVRALDDRNRWSRLWEQRMSAPTAPAPRRIVPAQVEIADVERIEKIDTDALFPDARDGGPRRPGLAGGEGEGHRLLAGFLHGRGARYHRAMSSPLTAYTACSRISAHLAWGCLSMRQVVQAARERQHAVARGGEAPVPKQALKAFLSRCHWHCHFIQKLESEPAIEHHAFHPAFEHVRADLDEAEAARRLRAFQQARTGFPFVDACLRALITTGWINFRMRAMLVSFAAYDLWLDWRRFAPWLARQFIDYEPGIHYSQVQMQSGTTGINTLRIYSPVKQGHDHDPAAAFIARWVPELAHLPPGLRHEPWKGGEGAPAAYPPRVVDHKEAVAHAKAVLYPLKARPETRRLSREVYEKHGSRMGPANRRVAGEDAAAFSRSSPPKPGPTESAGQGQLDFDGTG